MHEKEIIVAFKRGDGAHVKHKRVTISQLAEILQRSPSIKKKQQSNWFSLAEYAHSNRSDKNLKKAYGTVLDFDKGSVSFNKLKKLFRNYDCIIKTSYNHRVDKEKEGIQDRFHVILFYDKPISLEKHKILQKILFYNYKDYGTDPGSCKASQPTYFGSIPNRRKLDEFICYHNDRGSDLISSKITKEEEHDYQEILQEEYQSRHAEKDFDQENKVTGERTNALMTYASQILNEGSNRDTLEELLFERNDTYSPPLSEREVLNVVDGMYNKHLNTFGNKLSAAQIEDIISSLQTREDCLSSLDGILAMISENKEMPEPVKNNLLGVLAKKCNKDIKSIKKHYNELLAVKKATDDANKEATRTEVLKSLRKRFIHYTFVEDSSTVYHNTLDKSYSLFSFSRKNVRYYDNKKLNVNRFSVELVAVDPASGQSVLKMVDTTEFNPLEGCIFRDKRSGKECYNLYKPLKIVGKEGHVRPLKHHVYNVLFPENKEIGDFILNFLAHNLQNPGIKVDYMPIIIGPHGLGKSTLLEKIMMPLMGPYISPYKTESIKKGYTEHLKKHTFMFYNDLDLSKIKERHELTNFIRDLVTDVSVSMIERYENDKCVTNFCNYLAISNKINCIFPEAGERRFVYCLTGSVSQSTEYFCKLNAWITRNLDKIYNFLIKRDLSKFNIHEPPAFIESTDILINMQPWPRRPLYKATLAPRSENHICRYDVVSWDEIINYLKIEAEGDQDNHILLLQSSTSKEFNNLLNTLKELQFKPLSNFLNRTIKDGRVSVNGQRHRLWLTPQSSYRIGPPSKKKYNAAKEEFKERLLKNEGFF